MVWNIVPAVGSIPANNNKSIVFLLFHFISFRPTSFPFALIHSTSFLLYHFVSFYSLLFTFLFTFASFFTFFFTFLFILFYLFLIIKIILLVKCEMNVVKLLKYLSMR